MNIHLYILILIFINNSFLFAQHNIVKNGDFQETERNYLSNVKRVDIEFGTPKYWGCISGSGLKVIPSDFNVSNGKFRHKWNKKALAEALSKTKKDEVLVGLLTVKRTPKVPFSRQYLVGQLAHKLTKGNAYNVKMRMYATELACVGLSHFGVKLEQNYPNSADLSAREDPNAIHFPLINQLNKWVEVETVIRGQGGEEFIVIGCFLPEAELHLYQVYEDKYYDRTNTQAKQSRRIKRKKVCSERWGQIVFVSEVSVEALDSTEWALLKPETKDTQVLANKIEIEPAKEEVWLPQEKKHSIKFKKNEYELDSTALQLVLKDIEQLHKKSIDYQLFVVS